MTTDAAARTVRIATRESRLALWQANDVAERIRHAAPEVLVELVPLSTIGDRDRSGALTQFGGMGVFTREIQRAVLDGTADVAVHSLKDLPTETVAGLTLAGVPARESRFDALVLAAGRNADDGLMGLPDGCRIGTGSPRRQAQLLHVRKDLVLAEIRGNVETRLTKLDEGDYDAIVLAEAGLKRLGLERRISQRLAPPLMFPAVGQAALGIECRTDDAQVIAILERISDAVTRSEVFAERACLSTLRAGCHAPVGVLTLVRGEQLELTAVVLSPDGKQRYEVTVQGSTADPEQAGSDAARCLMDQGAAEVL